MSRALTWNNLDQKEKEVWLNQLGEEGGEASEYLAITGGTLTGALTTPGITSTVGIVGRTMALTSTASILGALNVGGNITTGGTVVDAGVLNIHTMAMTSTASALGAFTIGGKLTANGGFDITTIAATSTASIAGAANIAGALTAIGGGVINSATNTTTLLVQHTALAGASFAPLKIVASTASQAFFHLSGAVMSTASINISAAQVAGVVLVRFDGAGGQGTGYLPIFKGIV